jgi:hypothetical protein
MESHLAIRLLAFLAVEGVPHVAWPPSRWAPEAQVSAGNIFRFVKAGIAQTDTPDDFARMHSFEGLISPEGSRIGLVHHECDGPPAHRNLLG